MEIERKFLIDRLPNLPEIASAKVWQGYLSIAPVVRIRRAEFPGGDQRFEMTVKGKGTLVRPEVNIDITCEQYNEMEGLLKHKPTFKDYHVYDLGGGLKLECSIVDGDTDHGFMYAEVEFESVEAARSFVPPEYVGCEVTEDPGFSMSSYWINGRIGIN